ncbi:MAG: PhoH family protein [Hyphomonadaceae bacterium]|nr:PhoH family protein [Hyphomonadaceae bacterium]
MTTASSHPLLHVVAFADNAQAQAVMGPYGRHLAQVQEAFRMQGAARRAPAYTVLAEGEGGAVRLRAREDAQADLQRAIRVVESLKDLATKKGKVREGDVQAAIAFSDSSDGGAPVQLPQLGGLTIRTPRQLHYVEAMRDEALDLVFGVGPAGTGKTFLAVAAAVEALKAERIDRIVVTRPAVEAGERLGYLPGDLAEKVDPYLQPIWDAFRFQMGEADLNNRRQRRQIEVAPLAFMRGRTLTNAFVIVDEAQNATAPQMRMVLTRLGEGSRMVVTGDPSQSDLDRRTPSGLAHALTILDALDGVEIIRFAAQDVVRHRLVARIIEAYDRADGVAREGGGDDG